MMPLWIKEAQAIGQAFGTPLVALVAAYIAHQQYRLAQQKLKADLYSKRFVVYRLVLKALVDVLNREVSDSSGKDLHEAMIEARFLFDKPTFEYLTALQTKIYQTAFRINVEKKPIEEIIAENDDIKWLLQQLKIISERVYPFLNVDERLSLSLVLSDDAKKILEASVYHALRTFS